MPIGNGGIIGPANVPTITTASGVWSLREQQQAQGRGAWPLAIATDPYFEYTTLLLPGNGTNGAQNNAFLDGSTNNFTITRNGNTTQGTFSPFSQTGWGGYASATGQYLTAAGNAAFALSNSDFTIEGWIYPTALNTYNFVYNRTSPSLTEIELTFSSTGSISAIGYVGAGQTAYAATSSSGVIVANRWQHVAAVRSGGTLTVYVDGASVASNGTLSTSSLYDPGTSYGPNILNQAAAANRGMQGYCSNFRLAIGVAVYTGAFTPPITPLAATQSSGTNISAITGTQTKILTFQSNRFIDNSVANSGAGWTLTVNGSLSVQAFSPFNPTASWSAATNGGSGYFDGSGDYLSVADNANLRFGTSAFTIQAWIYRNASGTAHSIIAKGGASTGYVLQVTSTNVLRFTHGTTNVDTTTTIPASSWTHVAAVRTNTSTNGFQLYINGVSSATATVSTDFNQTDSLYIGGDRSAANVMNGYISGLKYTNGTAESISVPTEPPTATTNVALLTNFTNAGIFDATSKNDLETVGDARISNAVTPKWGSTSIKFEGTGDYLTAQNNPLLNLGSSNFTIEAWIYPTTFNTYNYLYGRDGATNATSEVDFYIGSSGNIASYFYSGSTGYFANSSGGAITTNSWQHVALVRNGVNYTIYVNGTSVATIATLSTLAANTVSLLPTIGNSSTTLTRPFTGYMQDFRFTKGIARYTANFTAPTAAFPTL